MLLMVEKRIVGGICHSNSINIYAKLNIKYLIDYNRNKEHFFIPIIIFQIFIVNILDIEM